MKEIPVYDLNGEEKGNIKLPECFLQPVREDLIIKAVLAEMSLLRQPYGTDPLAGKRTSAHYHGLRHYRYSMMNREMARMKRIHNQGYLNLTARFVPQAVKGRKAHPPKVEKVWKLKINKKERLKALLSAISASMNKELVKARGHKIDEIKHIPIVFVDDFQKLKKTKDVLKVLENFGLSKEIERCKEKKVRAGKGKMRGRRYKKKKGPLIIISKDEGVVKAARNIPGVDIALPNQLTVSMLAPGTHPGRLTLWTKSAIENFKVEK